jgi:carboxyl-terminal processing protease
MSPAKARSQILRSVKRRVLRHHINAAGIDYDAWLKRIDDKTPALLVAEPAIFESGVRELLTELGTSHTGFYHSRPRESLPQHTINATLRELSCGDASEWMFLDVFEGGPAYIAGVRPGDILEAIDGSLCVTSTMPCFSIGCTHTLTVRNAAVVQDITVEVPFRKGTKQRPPIIEPKTPIFRCIAAGIGLLKVPYFPGAFGMRFAKALDVAINDLKQQGCDRLIIDLRGSIGGSLGFARLASYLCSG